MKSWIKVVPIDQLEPTGEYFIAKPVGVPPHEGMLFYGRGLNGKNTWTTKPGIAIRVYGNEKLVQALNANPGIVAVKVPPDADKRWRARKRRF